MDDEGGQPAGRRIALGLAESIEEFASRHGAETWEEFAREDPLQWTLVLLELADDPATRIFFNLHNVDVSAGLTRAASGRGTPTDGELLQIHEHPSWWPRVEWWDNELRASNRFEPGVVS